MNTPDPREVLEIANEIVRLEDSLALAKAKWDAMFSHAAPKEPKPAVGRPARNGSVSSQVLAHMNEHPELEWDTEGLVTRLHLDRDAVASSLYNHFVAKRIERVSRGSYRALQAKTVIMEERAA